MQPPLDRAANHDLFLHIRVVVGVILALTIGKLLQGFARYIEFPKKQHFWPVHAGWAWWALLTVIGFWWWEFELRQVNHWTFFNYVYVLIYASSYYLLSALLFPREPGRLRRLQGLFPAPPMVDFWPDWDDPPNRCW